MELLPLTASQASAPSFAQQLYTPWGLLFCWLCIINVVTFFTFGADKLLSKLCLKHPKLRRIPEKNLLILSFVGGSLGALLGMLVWHHKTAHRVFRLGVPIMMLVQAALMALAYFW